MTNSDSPVTNNNISDISKEALNLGYLRALNDMLSFLADITEAEEYPDTSTHMVHFQILSFVRTHYQLVQSGKIDFNRAPKSVSTKEP
jgi:hypothetical protein